MWEGEDFRVIKPFQILHSLTPWPWANHFNFQNHFYFSEMEVKLCTLEHCWKKLNETMCEKCLAQILQRWYHSFPNPQYKGLDTTHNSKCLLTIEWKVSRYREKQNTYTHNLKFLIQSKVAALVFFFYLLYLNYFIFPFFKSLLFPISTQQTSQRLDIIL